MHHHKAVTFLLFHDKLSEFFLMLSIRSFANALVQLFLPIFVFTLRNSLFDVILFLFVAFLSMAILFPFSAKMTSKIGTAHTQLFSAPFIISFFFLLNFTDPLNFGLINLAILYAFAESFFWMPFHEEFSFISKSKNVGSEVGALRSVIIVTNLLGPFVGGLIIVFLGFNTLFFLVAFLMVFAQVPLLLSKDIKPRQKFKLKNIYLKRHLSLFFPFVGAGASSIIGGWFWPIFLFLIISNFLIIGSFSVVANVVTIIITLFIGYKAKKIGEVKLVKIGSILFALSLFFRAFVRTSALALGAWVFGGLTWPLLDVPFESLSYKKSKHRNKLEFFVMREHALCIGRLIIIGVVFLLLSNNIVALTTAMIVGGILTTWYWLAK